MFSWETLGPWYTPHSQTLLQVKNIEQHPPMGQRNLPHCKYSTRAALRTWQILSPPNVQYPNLNNHLTYQNKSKPWRPHLKQCAANTSHHRTTPELTARFPLEGNSHLVRYWIGEMSPGGLHLETVMIAENLCAAWLKMNAKDLRVVVFFFFIQIKKTENKATSSHSVYTLTKY